MEINHPGPLASLRESLRPLPQPQSGQVLIRVEAAGVNRPDILQREGRYNPPPGVTDIPGLEIAGEVVIADADGTGPQKGEKVCALVPGGGYAEYCIADAGLCLPIPAGLSVMESGGLCETAFTVWDNVFQRGALQAGQNLLVHGGTSGIGVMAIQLARAFGARVFTTAGTDEKCAKARELGAEAAINYTTQDFVEALKDLGGADLVLDMVGGDYLARNIKVLNPDGRHVSIAGLRGNTAKINIFHVMSKRLILTGSTLRSRTVAQKVEIANQVREKVWPMLESGAVKPVIDSVYKLVEAQAAHTLMATSRHIGKIMLKVSR